MKDVGPVLVLNRANQGRKPSETKGISREKEKRVYCPRAREQVRSGVLRQNQYKEIGGAYRGIGITHK